MSRTADITIEQERREAWTAARQAVRTYARDPSNSNASQVEEAWRHLRESRSKVDVASLRARLNGAKV
ncbi:MAG: hypothetical protein AAF495_25325 [Pseudomonadota bacterium]